MILHIKMGEPEWIKWKLHDNKTIDCVHVFKERKYNNKFYRICYSCKTNFIDNKELVYTEPPDINEYRNRDIYKLSKLEKKICDDYDKKFPVIKKRHTVIKRKTNITPETHKFYIKPQNIPEFIYSKGELRKQTDVTNEIMNLPDAVPYEKEIFTPDPMYTYKVNPDKMLNKLIKSGEIQKPKFLIKVK